MDKLKQSRSRHFVPASPTRWRTASMKLGAKKQKVVVIF